MLLNGIKSTNVFSALAAEPCRCHHSLATTNRQFLPPPTSALAICFASHVTGLCQWRQFRGVLRTFVGISPEKDIYNFELLMTAATRLKYKDGLVDVPDRPGIGIEFDEHCLKQYRVID